MPSIALTVAHPPLMPAAEIATGDSGAKRDWCIKLCNLPWFVLIAFLAALFVYVDTYSYDWPNNEDFHTILVYNWMLAGQFGILKVLAIHNLMHPVGFQYLLTFLIYKIFGVHIKAVIWANVMIVLGASAILAWHSRSIFTSKAVRAILPCLIVVFSFHPVQAEHLLWAFEIGWFFINAVAICNAVLIERFGGRAIGVVLLLLICAAFCPAQSCALWLCSVLHICLIPQYRGRLLSIGVLMTGFATHVLAIYAIMPEHGAGQHIAVVKFVLYCLALLGSVFGVREEALLVGCGAVLAIAFLWVLGRLLSAPKTAALRIAIVLICASAGFLLLFAAGRYQYGLPWALAAFHMGPLLVPAVLGLLLALADAFDQAATRSRRSLAGCGVLLAFLTLSVGSALPYALERGQLNLTREGLAKHVFCSAGYSRYVIASANIADGYYDLIASDRLALQHLCAQHEPARVLVLARPPMLFEAMMAKRPELHDSLIKVWEIYITHMDLVRSFPPEDPDAAKKLLQWAKFAATQRDGYDGLAPLSPVLQTIDLAAIPPAQGAP